MGNSRSRTREKEIVMKTVSNDASTPVKYLTKLLTKLSSEEGITREGISREVFTRHMFREYPDLSNRIFNFLTNSDDNSPPRQMSSQTDFYNHIQKILKTTAYEEVFLLYLNMYCGVKDIIKLEEFQPLLTASYNIFVDNHPEGPQICPQGIDAIKAVLENLFHKRTELKVISLLKSTAQNCPFMINILHSYVTYKLRTSYRDGIEPAVIDKKESWDSGKVSNLMAIAPSKVWILAIVLPSLYINPLRTRESYTLIKQSKHAIEEDHPGFRFPTHWSLLYSSTEHGCDSTKLLSRVLHYKGPTLMFLIGKREKAFCVCISNEWQESLTFWGDENCYLIQISPIYQILHKGSKIIYVNFSGDEGFQGLQIGTDTNEPTLTVIESLDKMYFNGKKLRLQRIEVWGCGSPNTLDQVDIRLWDSSDSEEQIAKKTLHKSSNDKPKTRQSTSD